MTDCLKILSVGNSFSVDTMEYLPRLAAELGVKQVVFGNLYIGGCSIRRHFTNICEDAAAYKYYLSTGGEWSCTPDTRISDAVKSEKWDWISIQHGSGDGSMYSEPAAYEQLIPLIGKIREMAWSGVKIAFNMTWVGDKGCTRPEFLACGENQLLLYEKIARLTETLILPMQEVDVISPVGTAIQNARTAMTRPLTRDSYHLSLDAGRYIAAMTFLKALSGLETEAVPWCPDGVDEQERRIAAEAVRCALRTPFAVTDLGEKL